MIESELAFDKDGEPFALPDTVSAFRVYQLSGGRGAPKLCYDREDGGPLTIGVQAGVDELRERVETSARYRLDAIDDEGKAVPNVPPAYVQVTVTPRNAAPTEAPLPANLSATDHAIRELVRANCELVRTTSELAKAVATQQPDLVRAAAELLRAADGAGLPQREPLSLDDEDDGDVSDVPVGSAGSDWVSVAHEALATAKMVAAAVMTKRQPPTPSTAASVESAAAPPSVSPDAKRTEESAPAVTEPNPVAVDPQAHLMAIHARLTPAEQTFVMGVLTKLSAEDQAQWTEQLTRMSPADAVALIRTEIKNRKEKAS
jgi:hypothetical protein